MNSLLQPHEILAIQRDIAELINGPDGCDVILHWINGTGAQDVYGKYVSEVEATGLQRAHASPVTNHNVSVRNVQTERVLDQATGDLVLLFLPTVDLDKTGLWFELAGLGNFTPELKPPTKTWTRDVLFASGQRFVTEVYCRPKR